jgi:dipeptidyl aminopeptidase/acylaminoacyl peptidase
MLFSLLIYSAVFGDSRNLAGEFSAPAADGWMTKMRSHKLLFVVAAILLCSTAAWSQAFTIEQVMSSPFPSELTAAKHGSRVAWVFDAQGVRNVWVADGPGFAKTARQVTRFSSDDGQPIASLRLTPDGQTVLYALGSEINGEGDSADPGHSAQQPKQQVWAKDVDSAEPPRLLGDMGCPEEDCEDIEISPDGKLAAWAAKKKIWLASVDGKQQAKELAYIRGDAGEPKWSPDSKSIAVVVDRGDHSLIGVYDLGGQSLRYLAPSVDKDDSPRWSPDGKWIAYIKTAGIEQKRPFIPQVPRPWEIWIADAATGQGHQVWHSGGTLRDSLPQETEDASFSFAGDRIVFGSEQDGRNHLYSVAVASTGAAPAPLTPGDFDVEDVALAPDRKSVIYSSNEADVDRRHIWRVSVEGGQPQRALSHGETIEWSPVVTSDGSSVVCLGSTATSPGMPYVLTATGREMFAAQALPKDFPSAQLVTPQQVIFKSDDGLTVHGQLFLPKNAAGKKLPALVFMHGGPVRQMMLGFHYMDYYHNAYAMNQYLASRGYAVLALNYRLGIMYGRDFREAPNSGWRGAFEYKDVVAAGKYLQALPQVDPQRVGLWGGSYGGFLTAMGLAKNSDIFKAGVDFHGVHDWSAYFTQRPYFGTPALRAPDLDAAIKLAWESSPDAYVDTWRSPVLLIQGDDDRNVAFEQTVDLAQRLRDHHVSFEQLVFPDEIHGFLMWKSWIRAYSATTDFFDRTLKQSQPIGEGTHSTF